MSIQYIGYLAVVLHGKNVIPWLGWIVTGLSPQRPRFNPRPVYVEFMWSKCNWDRFFSSYLFSHQYHSTNAPYSRIYLSLTQYKLSNSVSLNNTQKTYTKKPFGWF